MWLRCKFNFSEPRLQFIRWDLLLFEKLERSNHEFLISNVLFQDIHEINSNNNLHEIFSHELCILLVHTQKSSITETIKFATHCQWMSNEYVIWEQWIYSTVKKSVFCHAIYLLLFIWFRIQFSILLLGWNLLFVSSLICFIISNFWNSASNSSRVLLGSSTW